jgi:putative transposase
LVNDPTIKPLPKTGKKIGIDAGITSLITTSDGEKVTNPKHFNRLYKKLRKVQKALSRKTKGSNNRDKARLQVARIHAQIKDARTDFLQKLTTKLVRENDLIVVEDLAVRNMVKNRKSRSVARYEAISRSISDASWGEFFRQLEYKCQWYEKELIKIDRYFPSSKRCGNCGHTMDKLPLNIRAWECPNCKIVHDRDINASKNILAAGLAVSVCGATIRPEQSKSVKAGAKKQKPKS